MLEELLFGSSRIPQHDVTQPLDFSAMSNRGWAGSETTATTELAPNGDACEVWGNTGASSKYLDMTALLGTAPFTIGAYFKPSSYQGAYGTAAPAGWVFQLGPYSGPMIYMVARPGIGPGTPLLNSVNTTYDTLTTPVGVWRHLAFSYDPATGKLSGFTDGHRFGEATSANPSSRILSIGGAGDRVGQTGTSLARYGFRGLVSAIRYTNTFRTDDFDPLTW